MKALLALLLVSSSALAQDDLLKCRGVADDMARLRCYDGIRVERAAPVAPAVAGAVAAPAAAAAQPAAQAPGRKQLEQSFGMEAIKPPEKLNEIESHIVGQFDGWGPGHVFRLGNGQAWRVVDGSDGVTREMSNPKVKVVRGALGAIYLEIDGTNRSPKVKRVE